MKKKICGVLRAQVHGLAYIRMVVKSPPPPDIENLHLPSEKLSPKSAHLLFPFPPVVFFCLQLQHPSSMYELISNIAKYLTEVFFRHFYYTSMKSSGLFHMTTLTNIFFLCVDVTFYGVWTILCQLMCGCGIPWCGDHPSVS